MSKELAEILFPNVEKDITYYEELYPKRNLKEGAKVTRYAPSPTGFVHMGALFTALVDNKVSKQSDGVFYLRIEDTDQERSIENGISLILKDMKNFNIEFDEGPTDEENEKGQYGPYIQSKRKEIYLTFAKHLVSIRFCVPLLLHSRRIRCYAQNSRRKETKTRIL